MVTVIDVYWYYQLASCTARATSLCVMFFIFFFLCALSSRLPSWVSALIPNIFYVTEKAWNYYPYTITGELSIHFIYRAVTMVIDHFDLWWLLACEWSIINVPRPVRAMLNNRPGNCLVQLCSHHGLTTGWTQEAVQALAAVAKPLLLCTCAASLCVHHGWSATYSWEIDTSVQ